MKHFTLTLTLTAAAALMAVGCQEKPENGSVSLHSDAQMTLPAAATDTTISFTATADWTASVEGGEWLTVNPSAGEAGEISAELSASANSETASRTATVRISCGTDQVSVTVAQEGAAGDEPSEPEEPEEPEECPGAYCLSNFMTRRPMMKDHPHPAPGHLNTMTRAECPPSIMPMSSRILRVSILNTGMVKS